MSTAAVSLRSPIPPGKRRKLEAGFTIFEVAMATFVLTMAIGTGLIALGRGFASLDSARCISYASQIMQSEMEKLRLMSWGDGTTAGTGSTGITAIPTGTPATVDISNFVTAGDMGSRMSLTEVASDVHTGMIQITLTITWTTYDGRTMSRSYITYYGKNGLYDLFSA